MAKNMEQSVGSLQEQALKRKERLKALREKQLHVSFFYGVSGMLQSVAQATETPSF